MRNATMRLGGPYHVSGFGATLALENLERYLLTLAKRAEAIAFNGRVMDKDVVFAFARDESIAFLVTEPVDGTFKSHESALLKKSYFIAYHRKRNLVNPKSFFCVAVDITDEKVKDQTIYLDINNHATDHVLMPNKTTIPIATIHPANNTMALSNL